MTIEGSEHLTQEDEERLKDLFQKLDRNKDGRIDIDDLSAVLKSGTSVATQTKVNRIQGHSELSFCTYILGILSFVTILFFLMPVSTLVIVPVWTLNLEALDQCEKYWIELAPPFCLA